MRKLILGLLVVGLLAVGTPAMAQTADPLGLISSGAVIPYVGNGKIAAGSMSFLELASPVGDNSGAGNGGIGGTHMFFFDSSCVKGPASVGIPLTTNDFIIQRVDNIDSNAVEGLIAIGGVDVTGFFLTPLSAPIHARMLWFDAVTNSMRVLEPIGLMNFEDPTFGDQTWNPLRTGATFIAPLEGLSGPDNALLNHTTLYLVCPTPSVAGKTGVFPNPNPHGGDFPILVPAPQGITGLDVRVYGDDERFLRNGTTSCTCLSAIPVTAINGAGDVFGNAQEAPFGTYSEIESPLTLQSVSAKCGDVCTGASTCGCTTNELTCDGKGTDVTQPDLNFCLSGTQQLSVFSASGIKEVPGPAFTGYRDIFSNNQFDTFGRLSNGSAISLEGGQGAAPGTPLPLQDNGR